MTPDIPIRPTGREAVRRAVLSTAQQLFAARGTRTSLREVADAAGVNLGLIHRHVGNKDDLLTAVLEQGLRRGTAAVDLYENAGQALGTMLLGALRAPDFSRLMMWLALDPGSVARPILSSASRPARAVRRMTEPPPASDLHLALALSVVYAWPVLRSEILDVLEIAPAQRDGFDERMADLLADVVTGGWPMNA